VNPYPDFETVRCERIEAFDLEFEEYVHLPTGLGHVHLHTQDDNNVFLALFKTPARDNTGISHILEHMVLCGSKRFPVHDAFFAMANRSLNIGMNAFATPDCSGFHFSTRYTADFDNLLKVYLDGLFFPLLDPLTFAREGLRIDVHTDDIPSFNGVVFNEMKGAINDPNERMKLRVRAQLFPASRYSFNEGGEPLAMTDLNIDHLRSFHHQHYHPANTIFVTYGDKSAQKHQQKFATYVLNHLTPSTIGKINFPNIPEPKQIFDEDIDIENNDQNKDFVIAWRLDHVFNPAINLRVSLLQKLLIDTKDSPFQQVLSSKGITITPGTLSDWNDECIGIVFSLRLSLSKPMENTKLFDIFLKVLPDISPDTFPQQLINNALDRIELELKNLDSAKESPGLKLIRRIIPALLYDADATQSLKITDHLKQLQKESKDPAFIPNLVREYLLDNKNCVCVNWPNTSQIQPSGTTILEQRLAEIWSGKTQAEKIQLKKSSFLLQQQTKTNSDSLPILEIDQIQTRTKFPKLEQCVAGGHSLYHSYLTHTGVSHLSIAFDLTGLPASQTEKLPIYVTFLEHNAKKRFSLNKVEFKLLALSAAVHVLLINGKCLSKHADTLLKQILDLIFNTIPSPIDVNHTLINDTLQRLESNLHRHGHEYVMRLAASTLGPAANLDNQWNGVATIANLRRWKKGERLSADGLNQHLASITECLTQKPVSVLYVGDEPQLARIREQFDTLPTAALAKNPATHHASIQNPKTAWLVESDVNYCAQAVHCNASENPNEMASLYLLAALLETGYLRQAIRHRGGAYGAGARYDQSSHIIKLFSYRDPRLLDTVVDFENAWQWLKNNEAKKYLLRAKLTVLAAEERQAINQSESAQHRLFDLLRNLPQEFDDQVKNAITKLDVRSILENLNRLLEPRNYSSAVITDRKNEKLLRENNYKIENSEQV